MSGSQLRTTPVKAIASTLATRSSPSIPSPAQLYEPAVKFVLRHRLIYNIFLYSAVLSWIHIISWTIWAQGGLANLGLADVLLVPFLPRTLLSASGSWITGALPAIVLRKVFLTSTYTSAASPSTKVKLSLSSRSTIRAFITYATSAILGMVLHVTLSYAVEKKVHGDPRLSLFVKSRKHPHYLNGRLVFLLVSQFATAVCFSLRNIMLDRFVFRWQATSASSDRRWPLNVSELFKVLLVATLCASITLPFAATVFALARSTFPILYKLPVLHAFLRPFTGHFLRGPWTLLLPLHHFPLLLRAWFLAFTTLFAWESSDVLFDTFITRPMSISHLTADPNLTLVSGISSQDGTFIHFAYAELRELSIDQTSAAGARRTALFSDQKYNSNLWSRLVRASLLLLGQDYQLLLRRGKPPPPAPAQPPPKLPSPANHVPATPAPLLRKPIYQSTHSPLIKALVDSLGSDGPLAQAMDAGADAANIPELFRSVETIVLRTPAKEEVKKSVENAKGMIAHVREETRAALCRVFRTFTPGWAVDLQGSLRRWWKEERLSKVVQTCLPRRALDVIIIDVLSYLVCASLTEDRYGVVQRDIPKILEAMLSFLTAIEEYQVEINSLYTPPAADNALSIEELEAKEALRVEVEKSGEVLGLVGDGLKEGVARIVRTFGDKLLAFKFPPRTARKLQAFVDYC